jgi:hypothetical protein
MRDVVHARCDSCNSQVTQQVSHAIDVTQDVRTEEANSAVRRSDSHVDGLPSSSAHVGGRTSRTEPPHLGAGPVPEPNLAGDNLHAQILLFVCDRRQLVSIPGGVSSVPFSAATALHACRPLERFLVRALAPHIWDLEQSYVDEVGGAAGF